MPRKKSAPTSIYPVHITARCPNREPFPIPLPDVWEILSDFLYLANKQHDMKIHNFVLMPNHFHLIATSENTDFGVIMRDFMFHSSIAINGKAARINQAWGSRHFRCELSNHYHFMNAYKYVYQNPIRAGLVSLCENWQFSTLHSLLGRSKLIIPIERDTILFPNDFDWSALQWLNTAIHKPDLEIFQSCLKKTSLNLPKIPGSGRTHPLNHKAL